MARALFQIRLLYPSHCEVQISTYSYPQLSFFLIKIFGCDKSIAGSVYTHFVVLLKYAKDIIFPISVHHTPLDVGLDRYNSDEPIGNKHSLSSRHTHYTCIMHTCVQKWKSLRQLIYKQSTETCPNRTVALLRNGTNMNFMF